MSQEEDLKKLNERIGKLESSFYSAKVYSGAVTLALLILLGLSWKDIPRKARAAVEGEAVKQAEKAAEEAASRAESAAAKAEESFRDAIRHARSAKASYELADSVPQQVQQVQSALETLSTPRPIVRCKLQNEAIWGTCAPQQQGNRMPAVETSLTPDGGGWSGWSPWQVASEWNRAPHSCIRFRLYCETTNPG